MNACVLHPEGKQNALMAQQGPGSQEPTGTLCRSPLYTVTVVRTREVFQTAWSEEQEALLGLTVPSKQALQEWDRDQSWKHQALCR